MKRLIILLLTIILLANIAFPVFAAEVGDVVYSDEYILENGLHAEETITIHSFSRSNAVSAYKDLSLYDEDTLIAYIRFEAVFRYDGTFVFVMYKAVTHTDTYNGWSYVQNSFTESGNTVTLDAKLTKLLIFNVPFTLTLSCDENGNISYT